MRDALPWDVTEWIEEADDENDFNKPVTWSFKALFELYSFSDKYATTDFCVIAFGNIQKKFLQNNPQSYRLPHYVEAKRAAERMLPSNPLFRLLVDFYAIDLSHETMGDTTLQQAASHERLPSDFLAACLISTRRRQAAFNCTNCNSIPTHDCDKTSHTVEEAHMAGDRNPCYYHDHGKYQDEADRCASRWKEWWVGARDAQPNYLTLAEYNRKDKGKKRRKEGQCS